MKKLLLLTILLSCFLTHGCLAQYKVHVKPAPPPPLAFYSPSGDVSIVEGQGFVIGLGFVGGVGPWNCSLTQVGTSVIPTFVKTSIDNGEWCTLKSDSTPLPVADYTFNVVVTDSKGATSTVPVTITVQ